VSRAQSEAVATVLLLALVVVLVSGVGYVVLGTIDPDGSPTADVAATVTDGEVTLVHRGGEPLTGDDLTVVLRYDGSESRYDFATDGHYGTDAVFEAGERWNLDGAVPYAMDDRVEVILRHDPSNAVLFRGRKVAATATPTATPAPPAAVTPRPLHAS
jgi:FlaG/FlaF family flagellin (archaellin)